MSSTARLHHVSLLAVPVKLRARSLQHAEELVREMTLISQDSHHDDNHTLPARLVELAKEVKSTYGAFTAQADEQFAAALARGDEVIDEIDYSVPASFGPFARHLIEILDEADRYCRAGQHLLTLATPPDIAAYRMWVLTEFERQLAGERPIPWPEFSAPDAS